MKTVQVLNSFGRPKIIDRTEFVRQWSATLRDTEYLAQTPAQLTELRAMKARLAELAGEKFDALPAHST